MPAVRVKVAAELVGSGLNEAVTPFGSPETERFTMPSNELLGFTVIVLVVPLP